MSTRLDESHNSQPMAYLARKKTTQRIMELEKDCDQLFTRLDLACETLRKLEQQLNDFLGHYYMEVGPYSEQLEAIEQQLEQLEQDQSQPEADSTAREIVRQTHQEITSQKQTRELNREMRQLYHSVAKACHPDTTAARGKAAITQMKEDVIRIVNDAYARRNLGELWKIKWDLEKQQGSPLAPDEQIAQLQTRRDKMHEALRQMESRREKLENSPACTLLQRNIQMRLCGRDFTQIVVDRLSAQIEQKRKELVTRKIKTRYIDGMTKTHIGSAT